MTRDEILDSLDGRVAGGQLDEQDEVIEWIATFLASVEDNEKLVDIDWIVVIPAVDSSAQQRHFFGERHPWFIIMNGEKMGKDEFVQTFAHELAHCYYEDHERIPDQLKGSEDWVPIIELRADLKTKEWLGSGLKYKGAYLHCSKKEWKSRFPNAMSQEEALEFAKIENTDQIITQYKNKYP
jgi:hypothetical protein